VAVTEGIGDVAPPPPRGRRGLLIVVIAVGVMAVVSVLLGAVAWVLVVRSYVIPSEAMAPTLQSCDGCANDRIVVEKLTYRFGSPQPGDVVVFKTPPAWNVGDIDLVKRVIAVGGQTIECRSTTGLLVDGEPLDEPNPQAPTRKR
jgi:signal peptidase I